AMYPSRSMLVMRVTETCANPLRRSRDRGGVVVRRRRESRRGLCRNISAVMLVRYAVDSRAASTRAAVSSRASWYARGAHRTNQSLYHSIDLVTSAFHKCGLSAFTGIGPLHQALRHGRCSSFVCPMVPLPAAA